VVALAALAIAVLLFAALLAVIGGSLFLAEWLLGSMGWGILHGILAALGIAFAAGLLALDVPAGRVGRSLLVALVVALAVGGALGLTTFGPQVGAAVGITIGYLTWIALMGIDVVRTGVDTDGLKDRYYPTQTVETSKETLEWLQKRMPPGIGS
jgi:hypothetical protein